MQRVIAELMLRDISSVMKILYMKIHEYTTDFDVHNKRADRLLKFNYYLSHFVSGMTRLPSFQGQFRGVYNFLREYSEDSNGYSIIGYAILRETMGKSVLLDPYSTHPTLLYPHILDMLTAIVEADVSTAQNVYKALTPILNVRQTVVHNDLLSTFVFHPYQNY